MESKDRTILVFLLVRLIRRGICLLNLCRLRSILDHNRLCSHRLYALRRCLRKCLLDWHLCRTDFDFLGLDLFDLLCIFLTKNLKAKLNNLMKLRCYPLGSQFVPLSHSRFCDSSCSWRLVVLFSAAQYQSETPTCRHAISKHILQKYFRSLKECQPLLFRLWNWKDFQLDTMARYLTHFGHTLRTDWLCLSRLSESTALLVSRTLHSQQPMLRRIIDRACRPDSTS